MSISFWAARRREKKDPRLEFQLKDPNTFIFKTRYIKDHSCFKHLKSVARCQYEVPKQNLIAVVKMAARNGFEVVPIPDYVEDALKFDLNMPFDNSFKHTDIWKKMFKYQKEGVEMIVRKFDGRCILADQMG